jgi:response regulator RpfG family c-di-GMP phosphodiesterase
MTKARKARTSIRGKLNRLVLVSVGVALGFVAVLSLWQQTQRYLLVKREVLVATAEVFGSATSKAIAARDAEAVVETLRAIARVPGLIYAAVEDSTGAVLADMGNAVRLAGDLDLDATGPGSAFKLLTSRTVQITVPVIEAGRPVGRILLVSDTSDLSGRIWSVVVAAALSSVFAVIIGLLISLRMQGSITRPLLSLTETMARIERDHDYRTSIEIPEDQETGALALNFNSMIHEIQKAASAMSAREEEVIHRLSRAAERRDDDTGQHIGRMAQLCRFAAETLGLEEHVVDALHRAAPMHDVGKIGVRDSILFKKGHLDPDERREMQKHTEFGYEILRDSNSELIQLAAEIALSHHERWDGGGYPRGLRGTEIPLPGRIAAVADVCDALASERPYKTAWTLKAVRTYLMEHAGTQFDPACVHALLARWTDVEQLYSGPAIGHGAVPAYAA